MQIVNRILAVLLAAALTVAGALGAVEIVLAALGRRPMLVPHRQWSRWLGERTFDDGVVRVVLIGLALLGLLLLVAALRRGRPGSLPLPSGTEAVRVTASRRGLERTLASAARRAEGVQSARVKAGRRKVRIQASTSLREPGDLASRVTAAVGERLEELGLAGVVRPRVRVSRKAAR